MKIVCICERGNSRSVALAWLLKDGLGWDAVAIGIRAAGPELKSFLYQWADKIILVDAQFTSEIPEEYREKLLVWDVGLDRYFRGFEPSLLQLYKDYMRTEGWSIARPDMQ